MDLKDYDKERAKKIKPQILETIQELNVIVNSYEQGIEERKEKIKKLKQEIIDYELIKKKLKNKKKMLEAKLAIIELD